MSKNEIISKARYLKVDAGVRYWEDGYVNGTKDIHWVEQIEGAAPEMPLAVKEGDSYRWQITIDLQKGAIKDWPVGTDARCHYKVCDDGTYCLLDENGEVILTKRSYVPDLLDMRGDGFCDYIILDIRKDGSIKDWPGDPGSKVRSFVEMNGFE